MTIYNLRRTGLILVITSMLGMIFLLGCTTTQHANTANTADVASTAIGLSVVQGAAEANPLALPMIPVRYMVTHAYRDAPCSDRRMVHSSFAAVGYGAAVNNLLVIAGASFAPVGLLVGIPAYLITRDAECKLEPLTDEQILLLAQWRDAYINRDAQAVADLLDNLELEQQYAAFFERMDGVDVTYYNVSRSERGFVADYEATFIRDGETKTQTGGIEWTMRDGRIIDVG